MKYLLLIDADETDEKRMIVCDDRPTRVKKTQQALYGTDDLTTSEMDEWMDAEEDLAAGSKLRFNGTKPVRWMDVGDVLFSPANEKCPSTQP